MECTNMIITNPTEQKVTITIAGKTVSVDAGDRVEVSEDFGTAWLKTHQFLVSGGAVVEKVAPVVEKEEAKEAEEEVEEEVVTEKKVAKKK